MFKFTIKGFSRDINGNRVVKIKSHNGRMFSIQTNGNLPRLHRCDASNIETMVNYLDVCAYIFAHGTTKQKEAIL